MLHPSSVFSGRPLVIDDAPPVRQGHAELEFGFLLSRPHRGGREHRLPALALTYGLLPSLELGLSVQRIVSDTDGQPPVKGFEDLHLQTKYLLLGETSYLPALSLAFDLKVPTANRRKGLSSGRSDENFLLIATKTLSPFDFDLNLGYLLVDSPPREKLKNRVSGGSAVRWTLHKQWVLVGEIFGLSREAKGEKNEANFQIGVRYHLSHPIVLDAAVGRSLRPTGTRIQGTLGLTWSFPVHF